MMYIPEEFADILRLQLVIVMTKYSTAHIVAIPLALLLSELYVHANVGMIDANIATTPWKTWSGEMDGGVGPSLIGKVHPSMFVNFELDDTVGRGDPSGRWAPFKNGSQTFKCLFFIHWGITRQVGIQFGVAQSMPATVKQCFVLLKYGPNIGQIIDFAINSLDELVAWYHVGSASVHVECFSRIGDILFLLRWGDGISSWV
jgi:hypothetical protein